MKSLLIACIALISLAAHAAQPVPAATPPSAAGIISLTCNAFYLPARSIWKRTVLLELDDKGVRALQIDGVAVYSFAIDGTAILTAIDSERIQIDMALLTWSSDLRGIVSSQGRCER